MAKKISHIYWFAPFHLMSPSTRYRGNYPLQYLKKHYDQSYDFVYPDSSLKGLFHFAKIYLSALLFRKKDSLIVIQKVCTNRFYAKALKLLIRIQKKKTLYDIDDAEHYRYNTTTLHFFLKNCEQIAVGSPAIYDYCIPFNKNVYLQSSPVIEHDIKKIKRNELFCIGWVGDFGNGNYRSKYFSHKNSLYNILFPVLKQIKAPIKLSLIGVKQATDIPEIEAYFKNCPNITLDIPPQLQWENDLWVYPVIQSFDIAVAPMVNHAFNVAKSAFKAKQYLSCGIPTLASDIGENKTFVLHEINGIICKTREEFRKAICRFMEMSDEEYFKFSQQALEHKHVYLVEKYCELLLEKHGQ